jgi:hypothetical protein
MERNIDISTQALLSNLQVCQSWATRRFYPEPNTPSEGCQCNLEAGRQQYRQAFPVDKVPVSDRLDFRRLRGGTPARPNR